MFYEVALLGITLITVFDRAVEKAGLVFLEVNVQCIQTHEAFRTI